MSEDADEVLEAMARGIAHSRDCDGDDGFRACMPEHCVCRSLARAAIRALPAGWVVAKVPERRELGRTPEGHAVAVGYNACIDEFRASAVEVE